MTRKDLSIGTVPVFCMCMLLKHRISSDCSNTKDLPMSNLNAAAAAVAGCPTGCDSCALDGNNVVTCTTTGCTAGWFYALDGQCVGQFFTDHSTHRHFTNLLFLTLLLLFVAEKDNFLALFVWSVCRQ